MNEDKIREGCGIEFERENISELRSCGTPDDHFQDIAYCDLCKYKIALIEKFRPMVDRYVDMTVHKMEMWEEICDAVYTEGDENGK